MGGGLIGAAALSGCSVSDLTKRKIVDPEAADRALIAQARDLAVRLRDELTASSQSAASLAPVRSILVQQIAQFERSAGLTGRVTSVSPTLAPASPPDQERSLAQVYRALALRAHSGDVAVLLASAAAGLDQGLVA